ncbi:hypothetical protein F2Q69_00063890 [Brassica cretica]|uniref:Cotton fiber protein n=1 Tax=Brassica cretica TaxID=69181 RepID=A0A8S9RL82_BRACR|nr:hypothetical protein F2Q69_00063890 [Brassica cretica]
MGETKKKSRSITTQRTWSLVRMAFLWGRKGGIFKKWHMFELRNLFSKHLKALAHHSNSFDNGRCLGEKQLSFDDTPVFNVKMHRPVSMRSFGYDNGSCNEKCDRASPDDHQEEEEELGVDASADEFIANFYEQMKLQRQISCLKYKEHNEVV